MEYLHNDHKQFLQAINIASYQTGLLSQVIEKDYYVTLILRMLSEKFPIIVFKGGTSLSKCHRVINRFSEDIDVSFGESVTISQRKKLKIVIKEVVGELGLKIPNINETRSGRTFNKYEIAYKSVIPLFDDDLPSEVLLETSYTTISFPTALMSVTNYIGNMMETEAPDAAARYCLEPFEMKVQGIERTFIDKIFAICDYYLEDKVEKHSRHIFDIYKLLPLMYLDNNFTQLISDVRKIRKNSLVCPSAQDDIDISKILMEIISGKIYERDYENLTIKLLSAKDIVPYKVAVTALGEIANMGIF